MLVQGYKLLWVAGILLAVSATASAQFTLAPGSPFSVGALPASVAVGDFNGDGKPDLAIANSGDNTVTVLLGNGMGGFTASPGSPFPVGANPIPGAVIAGPDSVVAVGDFNRDGKLDLVVANDNAVTVLLGNGTGGFMVAPGSPFAVGAIRGVAVGDFNGDGKLDLAVAGFSSITNSGTAPGEAEEAENVGGWFESHKGSNEEALGGLPQGPQICGVSPRPGESGRRSARGLIAGRRAMRRRLTMIALKGN